MPYNIYKSDGTAISVPDNNIDNRFFDPAVNTGGGVGVRLVGRNAIDYGAPIAQNFLQLAESFNSNSPPPDGIALQGQLWFKKDTKDLHVNVSAVATADWRKLGTIASATSTTGTTGEIRVNDTGASPIISVWADGAWRQIWPAIYS